MATSKSEAIANWNAKVLAEAEWIEQIIETHLENYNGHAMRVPLGQTIISNETKSKMVALYEHRGGWKVTFGYGAEDGNYVTLE